MAVAFDAVAHGSTSAAGTSIPNFTLTIGGGVTNGAVVVGVAFLNATPTSVAVTIGGSSATNITNTNATNSNGTRTLLFGLATGASTGATTISVSWTGSASGSAGALSFSGVNQGTPFTNGTTHTVITGAGGGTDSVTVTSTSGDMTLDFNMNDGPTAPTSPTQTSEISNNSADFAIWIAASINGGGGTATHTWTFGAFQNVAHSGVNVAQAAAVASTLWAQSLL